MHGAVAHGFVRALSYPKDLTLSIRSSVNQSSDTPNSHFSVQYMRILQTIGGFGAKGGGTSTCTYDLLSAIHKRSPEPQVDLLTPDLSQPDDRLMGQGEPWIKVVPNDYRTPLALSKNLTEYLRQSDYDVYHTNGMWMHINHETCAMARRKGRPYLITPHGMLYPEALARSAWKKGLMRRLWFDSDIHHAACIHATCQDEMNHLRTLGYRGPVALIGNPVAVPPYTAEMIQDRLHENAPFWGVAFLGRLHPRKKVEHLLYGAAQAQHKDVTLYIIGKGSDDYEAFLHAEAERLGIQERVRFLGFLNGRDKFAQLARIDALFVPSDMENFGMIIPEALIVGTPVMASLGTPWKALNTERCGWWTDNSPEAIARVIDDIYSRTPQDLAEMGRRGRDYILRTFADEEIARQMMLLYSWIAGVAEKPDFVYD